MTNQKTRNMNSRNSPNILRGVSSKKKKNSQIRNSPGEGSRDTRNNSGK